MAEPTTLFDYLKLWAREAPTRVALADGERTYAYAEYERAVAGAAAKLAAGGVSAGDAVAIALPKNAALPICYLAAAAAGAVGFPVDYKAGAAAWKRLSASFRPRAVIAAPGTVNALAEAARAANALVFGADELAAAPAAGRFEPRAAADDLFYLNVTSGSGGLAKAAAATHANVIANARAAAAGLALGAADVMLCTFAAHAHPHETFARALVAGGTAAFAESILPRSILQAAVDFGVTALMGVPPLFRSLVGYAGDFRRLKLRLAEAGGMTTPASLLREFKRAFGIPLTRVWGATETSGIAFVAPPGAPEGSLGFPLAGYKARVLDAGDAEVPAGTPGELSVSGAACVRGYWRRGAVEPLAGPGVRTGDVVIRENDGSFTFVDRLEGLMKTAGEKVYTAEVERALRKHPAVAEAAVIPAPDEVRGQVPLAYVEPFPGVAVTAEGLAAFVRGALPAVKRPRVINVVKELPKMPSGKIDKRGLPANVEAEVEALASADVEIVKLLNRRFERLRELGPAFTPALRERQLGRLRAANEGPLHDETLEEIFLKINELMGY